MKNRKNLRNTWKILKSLTGSNINNSMTLRLVFNNSEFTDHESVAELFSDYFSEIANNIEQKLPPAEVDPMHFMSNSVSNSFFLKNMQVFHAEIPK